MADKTRLAWLQSLIGKNKSDEVIADTQQAAEALDEAGIEQKAKPTENEKPDGVPPKEEQKPAEEKPPEEKPAEETPPPAAQEEEKQDGDLVTETGVKLAQIVFDAVQGDLTKLTQEQLATVIADALRPSVEEETPTPTPAPSPEEEQQMQDTNKSVGETQKALTDLIETMVKDQGEMAKSYQSLTEDVATVKALAPIVQQLVERVDKLAQQLADRPRQASAADETTIDKDTEAAKAIESAVKKSVGGQKKILGLPVKDD